MNATRGTLVSFRKEALDNLRDRRAVVSALLFAPLFGPLLISLIMGFGVRQQVDEGLEPIVVPTVGGADADNLRTYLATRLVDIEPERFASAEALREAVRNGDVDVGLVVDDEFGAALLTGAPARLWIVSDSSNASNRAATLRLRAALQDYGGIVGGQRMLMRGVDPEVAAPLAVLADDVSTPSGRSVLLLGTLAYFLFFATLMGGLHVAIDSTAGERERGTLEPLLTLPIPRWQLVFGKFATATLFMAVSLASAIAAFAVATRFMPLAEVGMSTNLSPAVCLGIFGIIMPFTVLGAGGMMFVATFAKSFREAQTYTSLVIAVPTLPIVLTFFNPLPASTALMPVPSLSQHLLTTALIKGETVATFNVLASATVTVALGLLFVLATVRRYRSERLFS